MGWITTSLLGKRVRNSREEINEEGRREKKSGSGNEVGADGTSKQMRFLVRGVRTAADTVSESSANNNKYEYNEFFIVDANLDSEGSTLTPSYKTESSVRVGTMLLIESVIYVLGYQLISEDHSSETQEHCLKGLSWINLSKTDPMWKRGASPKVYDSGLEYAVLDGKIYCLPSESLNEALVYHPVMDEWVKTNPPSDTTLNEYIVSTNLISDSVNKRILVHLSDGSADLSLQSSSSIYAWKPEVQDYNCSIVQPDFSIRSWKKKTILVDRMLLFYHRKSKNLFSAFDLNTKEWLKVKWSKDHVYPSYQRYCKAKSMFHLGGKRLCVCMSLPIKTPFYGSLFRFFAFDYEKSEKTITFTHCFIKSFRAQQIEEAIDFIPIGGDPLPNSPDPGCGKTKEGNTQDVNYATVKGVGTKYICDADRTNTNGGKNLISNFNIFEGGAGKGGGGSFRKWGTLSRKTCDPYKKWGIGEGGGILGGKKGDYGKGRDDASEGWDGLREGSGSSGKIWHTFSRKMFYPSKKWGIGGERRGVRGGKRGEAGERGNGLGEGKGGLSRIGGVPIPVNKRRDGVEEGGVRGGKRGDADEGGDSVGKEGGGSSEGKGGPDRIEGVLVNKRRDNGKGEGAHGGKKGDAGEGGDDADEGRGVSVNEKGDGGEGGSACDGKRGDASEGGDDAGEGEDGPGEGKGGPGRIGGVSINQRHDGGEGGDVRGGKRGDVGEGGDDAVEGEGGPGRIGGVSANKMGDGGEEGGVRGGKRGDVGEGGDDVGERDDGPSEGNGGPGRVWGVPVNKRRDGDEGWGVCGGKRGNAGEGGDDAGKREGGPGRIRGVSINEKSDGGEGGGVRGGKKGNAGEGGDNAGKGGDCPSKENGGPDRISGVSVNKRRDGGEEEGVHGGKIVDAGEGEDDASEGWGSPGRIGGVSVNEKGVGGVGGGVHGGKGGNAGEGGDDVGEGGNGLGEGNSGPDRIWGVPINKRRDGGEGCGVHGGKISDAGEGGGGPCKIRGVSINEKSDGGEGGGVRGGKRGDAGKEEGGPCKIRGVSINEKSDGGERGGVRSGKRGDAGEGGDGPGEEKCGPDRIWGVPVNKRREGGEGWGIHSGKKGDAGEGGDDSSGGGGGPDRIRGVSTNEKGDGGEGGDVRGGKRGDTGEGGDVASEGGDGPGERNGGPDRICGVPVNKRRDGGECVRGGKRGDAGEEGGGPGRIRGVCINEKGDGGEEGFVRDGKKGDAGEGEDGPSEGKSGPDRMRGVPVNKRRDGGEGAGIRGGKKGDAGEGGGGPGRTGGVSFHKKGDGGEERGVRSGKRGDADEGRDGPGEGKNGPDKIEGVPVNKRCDDCEGGGVNGGKGGDADEGGDDASEGGDGPNEGGDGPSKGKEGPDKIGGVPVIKRGDGGEREGDGGGGGGGPNSATETDDEKLSRLKEEITSRYMAIQELEMKKTPTDKIESLVVTTINISKSNTCPIYKKVGEGHYASLVPVPTNFSIEKLLNLKHMNIIKGYFLLELQQKFLVTESVSTLNVFFDNLEDGRTRNAKKHDTDWWINVYAPFQRILSQAVSALVWLKRTQTKIDRNLEYCIFVDDDKNGLIMPSFDESESGQFSSLFKIVKKYVGSVCHGSFPQELQDIYNPYLNTDTDKKLDELLLFHPIFWGGFQKLTFIKKLYSLKKTQHRWLWDEIGEVMDRDELGGRFWNEVMGNNTTDSIWKDIYEHDRNIEDKYSQDSRSSYTKRSQIISYMRNCLTHYNDHAQKKLSEEKIEKLLSELFPWAYTEIFRACFDVVNKKSKNTKREKRFVPVRGVLRQMYYCGEYSA